MGEQERSSDQPEDAWASSKYTCDQPEVAWASSNLDCDQPVIQIFKDAVSSFNIS
jgi:hypothetical protein